MKHSAYPLWFMTLLSTSAHAELAMNLPPPGTEIAQSIYDLHTLVLWICFGIFLVVFIPMGYALWKHRKSSGHKAATFHENLKLEVLWTFIPVVILVGMAFPATRLVLEMKNVGNSDISIKVTGSQWKWEYEYMDDGVRFISNMSTPREQIANTETKSDNYLLEVDRPLVVPVGQKIRLVMTATDVIHSWWVPALGVKQDAVPGFIREAWFRADKPGTFRGQCAELCGVSHAFMPIVVEVLPQAEYTAWMADQKTQLARAAADVGRVLPLAELIKHGEKVYQTYCLACHQPNGEGLPPVFPALAKSPIATGPKAAHINMVFNGKANTAMQAFGGQLSDLDIAAVVTYERHSFGNNTNDLVQPAEVKALRK